MTQKKNVVFLLVDSLRADQCYGDDRKVKTPTIDCLIRRGTTFIQAISVASVTSPAVASILTGVYPYVHGIQKLTNNKLNPFCITLGEILKENGYTTVALVTGPLTRELQINRGFDVYLWREPSYNLYTNFQSELIDIIKTLSSGNKPWFLFIHLFELHLPRQVAEKYNSKEFGRNRYERAITSIDSGLEKIINNINFENTVVIFHADHGENAISSFLEAIFWRYRNYLLPLRRALLGSTRNIHFLWMGHGYHIYDFLIRVPLIFIGEPTFPGGKVISEQVSQIDILPTLIDGLNLHVNFKNPIQGRNLIPLIRDEKIPEVPLYSASCGTGIKERDYLISLRTSKYKFVTSPYTNNLIVLYDLIQDPEELKNIASKERNIVETFRQEIISLLKDSNFPCVQMSEEEKKEVEKKLKAIGYV